jgi:hypothetical protein
MATPEWSEALLPYKAALVDARRAGIELDATEVREASLKPGVSRLGGRPDLPAGTAWPVAVREKDSVRHELPLAFVAQLALAEVKPFDAEGLLPAAGLLSFFFLDALRVNAAVGWAADEATRGDRVRVVYTAPGVALAPLAPPPTLPETHVLPVSRLRFRKVSTWPTVEGTVIGGASEPLAHGIPLDPEALQAWAKTAPENPAAQLLGHPAGCEFPIGRDADARLLLSLDSATVDHAAPIFGRNGFLFIGIPGAALAARAWDQAFHKEW